MTLSSTDRRIDLTTLPTVDIETTLVLIPFQFDITEPDDSPRLSASPL
jgi:hypothetical protein